MDLANDIPMLKQNAAVNLPADITVGGSAISALGTVTSSSATALVVGPNGATNPTFQVDASTASAATGIKVKSAAAAGGFAISVLSSGTDENLKLDAKGAGTVTINGTATGGVTVGTALTPTGGVAAGGGFSAPSVFHSGGLGFSATTDATQHQIVTTESYLCEVFIPANTTLTGVSVLNGHTTSGSVNLFVGLANSSGTIVAKSATTTAQGTADAFQQIPFTATYAAVGPAKYFVVLQGSATTGYVATHTIGNFGAAKITSETYGTFLTTATYKATTFTTALGPVADTY